MIFILLKQFCIAHSPSKQTYYKSLTVYLSNTLNEAKFVFNYPLSLARTKRKLSDLGCVFILLYTKCLG